MHLSGCYTALVTPFENGSISYSALQDLIEHQIDSGVSGLVPAGTTGESPTLSFEEHKKLIKTVVDLVDHRCVVIAGTGGNSTAEALELTQYAKNVGADASLQVSPYYNKPSGEGLYRHFSTIAEKIELPMVLYNIPGRTGIEISVDLIKRLLTNNNVIAIKEASGSIDRVSEILLECEITVLSGDDSMTLPMIFSGAKGVISVASNLIPSEISQLTKSALEDDLKKARSIHYKYFSLFSKLFIETNPIPIKAALATVGKIKEEFRLPLYAISDDNRSILVEELEKLGLCRVNA